MVEKAEAFSGRKKNAPIKKPSAMAATAKGNDFSFRRETPLIFVGKTAGYLSLSAQKELHRAEQRRETFLGEEGKSGVFIHHNPALEKTPWRCTINQTILNVFLPAIIGSRRKNISALKNYLTE